MGPAWVTLHLLRAGGANALLAAHLQHCHAVCVTQDVLGLVVEAVPDGQAVQAILVVVGRSVTLVDKLESHTILQLIICCTCA